MVNLLFKILNFFKKRLKDPEEAEKEINLSNLGSWLDFCTKQIISEFDLDNEILNYINKVNDSRFSIKTKVEGWQKSSELKSYGGAEKIIPLFIETKRFLDQLVFSEQVSLDEILVRNSLFEQNLTKLIRYLEDSNFAEDYDFLNKNDGANVTINPLFKELIDLDAFRKSFERAVIQSGYIKIKNLKERLGLINETISRFRILQKELERKKERLALTEAKRKEKEELVAKFKEDPDYVSREDLEKERKSLLKEINDNKEEILTLFNKLKPLLDKYKVLHPENTLSKDYIDDPVSAFLGDQGLAIKHSLHHIKALLKLGRFSLSPEEVDSYLQFLYRYDDNYFDELHKNYFNLTVEYEQKGSLLKEDSFAVRIEDALFRLKHFEEQVNKLEEEAFSLEERTIGMKNMILKEKELLQNLIKVGLGKELYLKCEF
ncbi:MAG: hypothetical protein KKA62_04220 [Nanoarchaeota archaeon]|nr:hypothetical protein [Nanoarchaeota archaeon]MBU1644593.1 hypothetical protein [Nanoarchaeota archaeon]MBU1977128.1 hypothetical protein [Nanoarchaeota archaeon]